jgi:hypothetical protein
MARRSQAQIGTPLACRLANLDPGCLCVFFLPFLHLSFCPGPFALLHHKFTRGCALWWGRHRQIASSFGQLMCECCGFCITVAVRFHTIFSPTHERFLERITYASLIEKQLMISTHVWQVHDAHAHKQLQSRFENRCPVMLYSQMAGMAAGRVTRRC